MPPIWIFAIVKINANIPKIISPYQFLFSVFFAKKSPPPISSKLTINPVINKFLEYGEVPDISVHLATLLITEHLPS